MFLGEAVAPHEEVVINAGVRGILLKLSTADLIRTTQATIADIRVE